MFHQGLLPSFPGWCGNPEFADARNPHGGARTPWPPSPLPQLLHGYQLAATRAAPAHPQPPAKHVAVRAAALQQSLTTPRALIHHQGRHRFQLFDLTSTAPTRTQQARHAKAALRFFMTSAGRPARSARALVRQPKLCSAPDGPVVRLFPDGQGYVRLYDAISTSHRPHPSARSANPGIRIDRALGDALSVVNIGAGTRRLCRPTHRWITAVEPSQKIISGATARLGSDDRRRSRVPARSPPAPSMPPWLC